MSQTFTVFVTGATGLIGKWTLVSLSRQHNVIALARNAGSRSKSLNQWIDEHGGDSSRVHWIEGDLIKPALGLSQSSRQAISECHFVFHMGAAFSWGLTQAYAHSVTVDGSDSLLRLTKEMPDLKGIIHLTGFMLASPPVWQAVNIERQSYNPRTPLTPSQIQTLYQRFPSYEAAKFVAHFHMSHGAAIRDIPITNIELSSVCGHSESGELDQKHGLEILIKALWERKLPIIPGNKNDWLPVIAVDYLAEFVAGIIRFPEALGHNIVVLDDASPRLSDMIKIFSEALDRRPPRLHLPTNIANLLMKYGGERILGVPREPLVLIHDYSYDTTVMKSFADKMDLVMPDSSRALRQTARWWRQQLTS